ncbi:hypothetical protein [Nostoc sp.]
MKTRKNRRSLTTKGVQRQIILRLSAFRVTTIRATTKPSTAKCDFIAVTK